MKDIVRFIKLNNLFILLRSVYLKINFLYLCLIYALVDGLVGISFEIPITLAPKLFNQKLNQEPKSCVSYNYNIFVFEIFKCHQNINLNYIHKK